MEVMDGLIEDNGEGEWNGERNRKINVKVKREKRIKRWKVENEERIKKSRKWDEEGNKMENVESWRIR